MVLPWHDQEFEQLLSRRGGLPHALLLRGPEGIGKLAFAEALTRALLCENPGPKAVACGQCVSCSWLEQGSHPDFRRLAPETITEGGEGEQGTEKKVSHQIPVEEVRAIADFIFVTSHRGGAKVVLVHPAEALNVNAANALLKNLEEPPPQTYFLLVAHRWHQLLPTIRSRCQHIALPPPDADAARAWIEAQGSKNPDLALTQAGGAPLLALQLDEAYWHTRGVFLRAISDTAFDALSLAEQLRDCAPALVVGWLQKWSFDLASYKAAGRVRYNSDFLSSIAAAAAQLDDIEALRFHRSMISLQRVIAHPLNSRLFLEQLLLSYADLLRGGGLRRAA